MPSVFTRFVSYTGRIELVVHTAVPTRWLNTGVMKPGRSVSGIIAETVTDISMT